MERKFSIQVLLALVIAALLGGALAVGLWVALDGSQVAQSDYGTACYREQGGNVWVCSDGGTMRFEVGSTLTSDGAVAMADLTLSGDLGVVNIAASGDITAVNALLSGDITAVNALLSGDLDVANLTAGGMLTVTDEIVYGPHGLYPLGVGLPGFQIGGGRAQITGTQVFTHATGTAWAVLCAMETPTAAAGICGIERGTNAVTLTVYTVPTMTQAATPAWVNWLIMGQP